MHRHGLLSYLHIGTLIFTVLLLLALGPLLARQYHLEEQRVLGQIQGRIVDHAYSLDEKLGNLVYQVDGMRRWAQLALALPDGLPPSPLLAGVRDRTDSAVFTLDRIPPPYRSEQIGNVYGLGSIETLDPMLRDELNMALWMFPLHQAALAASPELAWVYYDSIGVVYAISPWIHSDDMLPLTGAESLTGLLNYALELDFIQLGTPERNPRRLPYWTPLYMDPAGKGLMVTHGAPVYAGDRFRGIVAADLTLDFLTDYLDIPELDGHPLYAVTRAAGVHGGMLAAGESGRVISASGSELPPDDTTDLSAYLPPNVSVGQVFGAIGQFTRAGDHFLLNVPLTVAPWSLVHARPVAELRNAILRSLSPLLISVTLLLVILAGVYLLLRRQMRERERFERTLHAMAISDPLTGVFNQRHFRAVADVERERARRYQRPLSLLLLDLDHFKQINDRYGHATGDRVLKGFVAHCLRKLRAGDTLARIGGEEFAILLPETDVAGACQVAENLRREVETDPPLVDGQPLPVTVSIGVAALLPGDSIDSWVARADSAMYEAKHRGRNRVERIHPEPALAEPAAE
jgi:diguanylate cyclase (GGDEF)-like protein